MKKKKKSSYIAEKQRKSQSEEKGFKHCCRKIEYFFFKF